LSREALLYDYLMDLVEEHLGDLIEEVVEKYYSDYIDLEMEYENVLRYITQTLAGEHGEYEDPDRFRDMLKKMVKRKNVGKLIISYLVSKYIESFTEDDSDL